MKRHRLVYLIAPLLLVLAPLAAEAAKITGLSASPSEIAVQGNTNFVLTGSPPGGGPCIVNFDFGGAATPEQVSLGLNTTWQKWFYAPGTFTITVTSTNCEVQAGKVTTTLTVVKPKVTIVDWKATPANYQGSCPAKINFSGKIQTDRPEFGVAYQLNRSDKGSSKLQHVPSSQLVNGQKTVQHSWTLGGPKLPSYSGWMKLKITYPVHPDQVESPAANFTVTCTAPPKKMYKEDQPYPKPPGPPPVEKK